MQCGRERAGAPQAMRLLLIISIGLTGCGTDTTDGVQISSDAEAGGTPAGGVGGSTGSGGITGSGGSVTSAGGSTASSGGTPSSGGATSAGGSGTGGVVSTGGLAGTGGVSTAARCMQNQDCDTGFVCYTGLAAPPANGYCVRRLSAACTPTSGSGCPCLEIAIKDDHSCEGILGGYCTGTDDPTASWYCKAL